jgi:hypothetical protein
MSSLEGPYRARHDGILLYALSDHSDTRSGSWVNADCNSWGYVNKENKTTRFLTNLQDLICARRPSVNIFRPTNWPRSHPAHNELSTSLHVAALSLSVARVSGNITLGCCYTCRCATNTSGPRKSVWCVCVCGVWCAVCDWRSPKQAVQRALHTLRSSYKLRRHKLFKFPRKLVNDDRNVNRLVCSDTRACRHTAEARTRCSEERAAHWSSRDGVRNELY